MAVLADLAGRALPVAEVDVERGQLRFFAEAIGETDPVWSDVAAARAAGHPDLPAPPTFLFGLEVLTAAGVDLRRVPAGVGRRERADAALRRRVQRVTTTVGHDH